MAAAELVDRAGALVRRSRAGDQNATATIYEIGQAARKGNNSRASAIFQAIQNYVASNPFQPFRLGAGEVLVAKPSVAGESDALALTPEKPTHRDIEARKPPVPRGLYDKIFNPEERALAIVRAAKYRNGIAGAAAVLASGPLLTRQVVEEMGMTEFGSEESTATFFHGVKFPDEATWADVAPHLEPPLRRCFVIGQCVGRARKIQQVRQPGSQIGAFSQVAGWELGE